MPAEEAPSAVSAPCPDCGEETFHTVLRGRQGRTGATITLDATLQCTDCDRVHHMVLREPAPVEIPAIVSRGNASHRSKILLPGDDDIVVGDLLIVDELTCKLTGIDDKTGRRVDAANVADVKALWLKEFEVLAIKWAINLDRKTITKVVEAKPEDEFTVGEERVFGRLRVTIHAIKTEERLMKRGTAEAGEIRRIFAAPTPLGDRTHRPDKRAREAMREKEGRG